MYGLMGANWLCIQETPQGEGTIFEDIEESEGADTSMPTSSRVTKSPSVPLNKVTDTCSCKCLISSSSIEPQSPPFSYPIFPPRKKDHSGGRVTEDTIRKRIRSVEEHTTEVSSCLHRERE